MQISDRSMQQQIENLDELLGPMSQCDSDDEQDEDYQPSQKVADVVEEQLVDPLEVDEDVAFPLDVEPEEVLSQLGTEPENVKQLQAPALSQRSIAYGRAAPSSQVARFNPLGSQVSSTRSSNLASVASTYRDISLEVVAQNRLVLNQNQSIVEQNNRILAQSEELLRALLRKH